MLSDCTMQSLENILLWNLMAAVIIISQAKPKGSSGVRSDCAGNLMRLSLDKALALGNQLEVEAVNDTQHIQITPALAAQCGYSMESDPWGNTRIYTSLMGCYVDNKDDTTFTVGLTLRMYSQASSEMVSHDVSQTCSYSRWASREILCDRNYMERRPALHKNGQSDINTHTCFLSPQGSATPGIWKLTFHTPGSVVPMVLGEAEQNGYSARITSKRLVVRSPYSTSETYQYPDGVAKIPMEMFKVSVYYNAPHGLSVVDMAAACPTGGVLFNEDLISWYVPRSVTPLLDGAVKIIEVHMGINGQRLDKSQMTVHGYTLSQTEFHIIAEMRVGSPDGYYKSHALDYQYHITYTIEPMLEVLWKSVKTQEDTRYKILFPITTPAMPGLNQISNIPEDRVFDVHMWNFLYDVELVNITFSSGVFTVEECNAMGFAVQDHRFPNGTKSFSLKVPFDAAVVLKHNTGPLVTNYVLSAVFGFIIMPEYTPFAQPVEMQVSLQDVVLPTVTGVCDQGHFHITVKYGNQGASFDAFMTIAGPRQIIPEIAEAYKLQGNATHFSFSVPYDSPDTAFEFLNSDSVRARLDVLLWDSHNEWVLGDLHLACSFPLVTTQCHPNGTMSALAVKVDSTPNLVPSWLTLRDMSCKPVFSDDRFAYFYFGVDSCGTTRTFFDDRMLYENEIRPHYHNTGKAYSSPADPEYKQTISCYYKVDQSQTVAFGYKKSNQPAAEIGTGQLMVQMRIAKDVSYESFHAAEDYPVTKYLKEPVYFEVELMHSVDQHLELILMNCWATLEQDRTSLPSWDIIINGCADSDDSYVTILHPVKNHDRAAILSHAKRFSIKMFTFTQEQELLKHEIYVHCDALICDKSIRKEGACSRRCAHPTSTRKAGRSESAHQTQISSGPIRLNG
uniref:Zona pellucida protein AX 1 n=1 Tax=Sphaeramia orbicularis TaxID=375764 RepID=A0A673BPP8_9TELE